MEQIRRQTSEYVKLVQYVNKPNLKWWSRLDENTSKTEALPTLIEGRDDAIQS